MFGLSRLVAYAIVFLMGFGLALGLFVGIPAAMVANYSLRDLENTNLVNIPDEQFFDQNVAVVDLLGLNGIGLYNEFKELQTFDEADLNINTLEARYGIIFHEKLELLLTDEARAMPLKQLFSMDGVHAVLQNVYIGHVESYECMNADGTPGGDPADATSYWQTKDGSRISTLEEVVADFNLNDFISGNINTDSLLHGDKSLRLADILGYTQDEGGVWYDADGNKVTGIMSVFADCTLDDVDDKINEAYIGELLSYTKVMTGVFDEHGNETFYWTEYDSESGTDKKVTGLMAVVAGRTIGTLGGLYDEITVGDLVPEEDRTGIFAIIGPETSLNNIASAVNDSIMGSPLQFFMNEKLITFDGQSGMLDDMATYCGAPSPDPLVDKMGYMFWEAYKDKNLYTYFEVGSAEYEENKKYFEVTSVNEFGNDVTTLIWEYEKIGEVEYYKVPTWRTKELNASFGYIISLVSCTAPATPHPTDPIVIGD